VAVDSLPADGFVQGLSEGIMARDADIEGGFGRPVRLRRPLDEGSKLGEEVRLDGVLKGRGLGQGLRSCGEPGYESQRDTEPLSLASQASGMA
jgi:hypothetical protein